MPAAADLRRGKRPELLTANAPLWSKAESYLYTDSASSAGKYLDGIAENFGDWSVSCNNWTGPLEAKAAELPEMVWSAAEQTRWRDGSEHTAQYAWFWYQPGVCDAETFRRGAASGPRAAVMGRWRITRSCAARP